MSAHGHDDVISRRAPSKRRGTVSAVLWFVNVSLLAAPCGLKTEADLPCDFSAVVASRRGLNREGAEQLIEQWLASYFPLTKPQSRARPEEHHDGNVASYDICA